ncbi:MAG: 4-(cytidine 5'-diphospho)-2-C-methyl-D-erythritol kinase [bacterium]|nr:4-(cytidine 5'-diphospho)-2-C-methyl-D-erythritol kinase [bacterium]
MVEYDVIKAYAKINLGLWITEKRSDGYHNIVTVFHKIGLYDTLTIYPSETFEVVCYGRAAVTKDNILYKVKDAIEKQFKIPINYKIEIKKNIPVGSGLGGASSNAAYFLKYLNEKRGLNLSQEEIIKIGEQIGSDVPFFLLKENAAIATGRGEILEPFHSAFNYPLILGFPDCQVLTSWAYAEFDRMGTLHKFPEAYRKAYKIAEALKENDLDGLMEIENSFQPVVIASYPQVQKVMDMLSSLGAKVISMSGSGSAVYGIFERMILIENFGEVLTPTAFLEME